MEALIASYGNTCDSDDDSDSIPAYSPSLRTPLPPPPLSLLNPPNSLLVLLSQPAKKEAAKLLQKVSYNFPGLHVVDADISLENLHSDIQKVEKIALGREFHVSLGRTVPIRVHQIDSVVSMLRQKLQSQKRYWIDFTNWEIFVNGDGTRTFISIEVNTGGLSEITKQIQAVNEVYRLHNLPEFYKDPRPHIKSCERSLQAPQSSRVLQGSTSSYIDSLGIG